MFFSLFSPSKKPASSLLNTSTRSSCAVPGRLLQRSRRGTRHSLLCPRKGTEMARDQKTACAQHSASQ
eukprot:5115434-Pleurochrysis_carterae.AAC.1